MAYTSRLDFGPYGDFGIINIPTNKEPSMPAVAPFAPAIIGAVGSLGGAIVGSRSQNKATEASSRANAAALQYQREKDTLGRQDWEKAMRAYEANRNALLRRYGVDVPASAYGAPMGQQQAMGVRQPMYGAGPARGVQPQMRRSPIGLRGMQGNLGEILRRGGYTGRMA